MNDSTKQNTLMEFSYEKRLSFHVRNVIIFVVFMLTL